MLDEAKPGSTERQTRAKGSHFPIAGAVGLLALVTLLGGVVTVMMGFLSPTEFEMFGAHLSTLHVGGALVAVGFITAVPAIWSVRRWVTELAALPPDEEAERQKE